MIDFKEIAYDSDDWELFARDYLVESGFYLESTPDRGPDGGKDLLVTEEIRGNIGTYKLRWLVSCKHFATSQKAVKEDDEQNPIERMQHFKADGFIGFYSTLPSSGLNSRMYALRSNGAIKDYKFFDHQIIANTLITGGYSHLMMRYFPVSYQSSKPLHLVVADYQPLTCIICGKDLLKELYVNEDCGHLIYVRDIQPPGTACPFVKVCVACKKGCDRAVQIQSASQKRITSWKDLSDLVIPPEFMRYMLSTMNRLRAGYDTYTDEAFSQEKDIMICLAQRVLRMTTERERQKFARLLELPPM